LKYNRTEKRNIMFLKQKSFLASLFIASFLVIIVNSGYCANNDLTSLNDVNSIDIVAYKKNNTTLYVSFIYRHHRTDQLVYWKGSSSRVSCNVYELVDENKQKDRDIGRSIGSIRNHDLNDYYQGIYIDVVTTNEEWALVGCEWTFDGKTFYAEEKFLQHKLYYH